MHMHLDIQRQFCQFVSDMKRRTEDASPTLTHQLIWKLHARNQLLRVYNQNIDGLEDKVALMKSGRELGALNVKLHGQLKCVISNGILDAANEAHWTALLHVICAITRSSSIGCSSG